MTPTTVVAYLALFFAVGFLFVFANLLVGKLLRPYLPNQEKLEVYECGEPTIGSSYVQFDLRFYVVALLFLIFDVEVALFFPWATVFGKAVHLQDPAVMQAHGSGVYADPNQPAVAGIWEELTVPLAAAPTEHFEEISALASKLGWLALGDILVFFGVVMVGFFYVWKRGDLDWVRAMSHGQAVAAGEEPAPQVQREPALTS